MADRLVPPETFETERLLLRRAEERDARAIFEGWASDPDVTRYLSWRTQEVVDHSVDYTRYARKAWDEGSDFIWMIERDRRVIGGISFGVDGHRAVFGFVLRKDAWRNGYTASSAIARCVASHRNGR